MATLSERITTLRHCGYQLPEIAAILDITPAEVHIHDVDPASPDPVASSDDALILAPATTARNVIQSSDPAAVPLTLRAAPEQTGDLLEVQASGGDVHARILSDGRTRLGGVGADFHESFRSTSSATQHLLANPRGAEPGHQYAAVIQTQADGVPASSQVEGAFIAAIANHPGAGTPAVIGADIEAFNVGPAASQIVAAYFYTEHDGTGHAGVMIGAEVYGAGNWGGGDVGAAYGVQIRNQQNYSGAVESAALKILAQSAAAGSYAILSEGGRSLLKSGGAAVVPLIVQGDAAQTADVLETYKGATKKSGINAGGAFVSDDAAAALVLKDTQGTPHYWRVTVSNLGVLTTTDLGTTRPTT